MTSSPAPVGLPAELAQVKELDPDGDVIISCQAPSDDLNLESNVRFRVSSKILSLMSPVFKALLSSSFKEGTYPRSTETPLDLPLPEDNTNAISALLHIAHMKSSLIDRDSPKDFITEVLDPLIVVADKYDCGQVVAAHYGEWLKDCRISKQSTKTLNSLAKVAYMLKLPNHFNPVAEELLLRTDITPVKSCQLQGKCFIGLH